MPLSVGQMKTSKKKTKQTNKQKQKQKQKQNKQKKAEGKNNPIPQFNICFRPCFKISEGVCSPFSNYCLCLCYEYKHQS